MLKTKLHTETFNVWSLIFASAVVVCVMTCIAATGPLWALPGYIAFVACPLLHLPFSCGYHTFSPISEEEAMKWRTLDIIFIFVASIPLAFALSWPVFPWWGVLAVTLTAALVTAIAIPLIIIFKKAWTMTVGSIFVGCIAAVYVFPMGWLFVQNLLRGQFPVTSIAFVGVILSLLGGSLAVIYNWPQCCAPGDWAIGYSHNVMRCGIIAALFFEMIFMIFAT
jgi:adiponectin receptor